MNDEEQDPLGDMSVTSHLAAMCAYHRQKGGEEALRELLTEMIRPSEELFKAIANDPSFTEQDRKIVLDAKSLIKKQGLQDAAAELRQMGLYVVADLLDQIAPTAPCRDVEEIKAILSSPYPAERRGGLAALYRQRLINANRDDDGQIRQIRTRDGILSEEALAYLQENCPPKDIDFMIGRNYCR
jgi:hypothetical protein